MKKIIDSLAASDAFEVGERKFFSAEHEEIASAATTDIYFVRTMEILRGLGIENTPVTAEIFARKPGIMAGTPEALALLEGLNLEVEALPEGESFKRKDVLMRIRGPYGKFCVFETALLGILASSCGWSTAAAEIMQAAGDSPVTVFGARHLHPAVAPVMERAALVGGVGGASCILGAKEAGKVPSGTAPHSLILMIGDTVKAALAYHQLMPSSAARIILADTFKDEAEEAMRLAEALGKDLYGVRLDTPGERGGVNPELVIEIRARLDQAGFGHVKIFVSGGLTPERITLLKGAGADAFGVGSYISGANPIDMTMDLKEINGKAIAKRGRIPGITPNPKLKKYS